MADIFTCELTWQGAGKGPTLDPRTFSRDLEASCGEAGRIEMSSAPAYRGDPTRFNPEVLLVTAVSACQALTYLFLAAQAGVAVHEYTDRAEGQLGPADGRIRMTRVTLRPHITLEPGVDEARARELVDKAHRDCFIANSLITSISLEPTIVPAGTDREHARKVS